MELPRTGSIRGSLACAENPGAVAGITLRMWRSTSQNRRDADSHIGFQTEIATDQDGRFSIAEVPAGEYTMRPSSFEHLAFYPDLPDSIQVKAGETTALSMAVHRAPVVRGKVVDAKSGAGIKDVALALGWSSGRIGQRLNATARTDADGNFQVYVTPGIVGVHVNPVPGYIRPSAAAGSVSADVTGDTTLPAIRLNPAGAMEGVVVDEAGKPVAGAEVGFSIWFSYWFSASRYGVGPEAIVAIHRERRLHGHVPMPDPSQPDAAKTPLEIRLVPTGAITGRVLDGDKPVVGVQINLHESKPSGQPGSLATTFSDNAKTDENGRFEFRLVEADKPFYLMFHAQGFAEAERGSRRVQVAAGRTLEAAPFLVARKDKSVSGMVVDPDGNPVAGATVSARLRSSRSGIPGAIPEQPTGKDGRFMIREVPNLPLTLMAYIPPPSGSGDRRVLFPTTVDAEPGQTDVRIVLDPKLVRGKK
jgi:hypothetical protein